MAVAEKVYSGRQGDWKLGDKSRRESLVCKQRGNRP